ncbi:MAG: DUF882 domain-containing protein [Deltaproteobacteria bacterium]|nr:DUF882 domain-containing protein [Deltaproteobacteria bacterium]
MSPSRKALPAALVLALLGAGLLAPSEGLADPPRHGRRTRARRRPARVNLAVYRANVRRWHDPSRLPGPRATEDGRYVLRLYGLNNRVAGELAPTGREGAWVFDEVSRAQASRVLEDTRAHATTAIDVRLLEVVYTLARHFQVGQVTVVSGYRARAGRSNHALGRAVDLVLPGVRDEAVAAYARTLGFLGVGVYPVSGFVHVDVRSRSFFWVDPSVPGRRSRRLREVRGAEARAADEAARARGVTPLGGTGADDGADDEADEEVPSGAAGTAGTTVTPGAR